MRILGVTRAWTQIPVLLLPRAAMAGVQGGGLPGFRWLPGRKGREGVVGRLGGSNGLRERRGEAAGAAGCRWSERQPVGQGSHAQG